MTTARREKGWGQPSRFIGFYRVKLVRPWDPGGSSSLCRLRPLGKSGLAQTCPPHRFRVTTDLQDTRESQMRINRRTLLGATAGLAMTKLDGPASSQPTLTGSGALP